MLISNALAAHFTPASQSTGGAKALSIILGVGLLFFVLYIARKKWRARKLRSEHGGE